MTEETIPQMRETIDRLQKDLKASTAKQAELESANRLFQARDVARTVDLDPKLGELYAKSADGDITPDGLQEFADNYGLVQAPAETSEAPVEVEESGAEAPGGAELSQMARGGSSAGEGAGSASEESMTRAEWTELSRTDPTAARQALAKGRVQISSDNPYAGGSQRAGNPFARGQ